MFTNEEIEKLYVELFDKMTLVGWLKRFTFTDGKGYHLTWTEEGSARSVFLKIIAEKFSLTKDDRAPHVFDTVAHGGALPSCAKPFKVDEQIIETWCECIDRLGIQGDDDRLLVLVHIVTNWAPDADAKIVFGEK